ncbi:DUF1876 domain-containing protein [Streptomyces litchfieldiae]|uniref:DUF1876 domain-containing protein n=1 Tax=Streptomyces litchfieldiae TaxID=3075543 RepID=A0ABU2MSL9_9ACTN|nr:DUF1876 domain-containing protein [Streptomyces sp. DSM 44938]MDT0344520.1 DUF1876 domain-containing protein [Streptomyces sp. DSM 44938]
MKTETWNVRVSIESDGRMTRAQARLEDKADTVLVSEGMARANPSDENVPDIGHELAAARALSELSHQLAHLTALDIESHTHEPVRHLKT